MATGTISQKIFSRASGSTKMVEPGEIVEAGVDYAMSHDGTSVLAIKAFQEMGSEKVWDPERIVIPFDHIVPANNETAAELQRDVRAWAKEQNISNFFDCGSGVCHQVFPEQGFALPGLLLVGADSHSCTYGALGAFGTGVGATDMAEIYSRGRLWFKVPETIAMRVSGTPKPFVCAKDIALMIIGKQGADGATYKTVEYIGPAIEALSISGRMTLCNLGVEMGAKAAIVPPDKKTHAWLEGRARQPYKPVQSDPDSYDYEYEYDITDLEPQVAVPYRVDNVKPVSELEGLEVDQVFIGTCTNGRLEDLDHGSPDSQRKAGYSENPDHPGITRGLAGGTAKRHHPDAGGSGSDDRAAGMRTLPGGAYGRPGGRRGLRLHIQPQLPGKDGQRGAGLPGKPSNAAA